MTDPLRIQPPPGARQKEPLVWSLPLEARAPGVALHTWLYDGVREAIVTGRLPAGSLLPGSRAFAHHYSVARGTVQSVYDRLLSEGYVEAHRGSGTRVSATLPDYALHADAHVASEPVQAARRPEINAGWRALFAQSASPFAPEADGLVHPIPFMPHRADVRSFPIDLWRRLHAKHLRSSRIESLWEANWNGLPALRQAIAQLLNIARGMDVDHEQVIVLGSTQQALDVCLRLFTTVGDSVWMEEPGYGGARQLMQAAGVRVTSVGIDDQGLKVEDGIRDAPGAKLVYTTPSHQSPLGETLSDQRRQSLLRWAADSGALIFEDDYNSEYRFTGTPLQALQGYPGASEHVVFAGTFSKLLFPALRLGILVSPPHLVGAFSRAASLMWRQPNGVSQAVLADFIIEGHFDHYVRRMRKVYSARADAFYDAARRYWTGLLDVRKPNAGLDTVCKLLTMDETEAMRRLKSAGVAAFPLSRYQGGRRQFPALVMGFAPYSDEQILQAAQVVEGALRAS